MKSLWMIAGAMVAVAGVGGLAAKVAADALRPPEGLKACTSTAARVGLRDALMTRIAARGGETDVGYAVSLDTPRLESIDYPADRTVCAGVVRIAVPEYRRAALDGVSELSDPVRFMIEPSRNGRGQVVALVGGGDTIAGWLGATPAPPPEPPVEMLRADYRPPEEAAPEVVETSAPATPEVPAGPTVMARAAAVVRALVDPAPPAPTRAPAPRASTPASSAPRVQSVAARTPSRQTARLNADATTTRRLNEPVRPTPPTPVRRAEAPPPPPSGGPSFDCRLSRNAAERTICADPNLARMDVAMAGRYARIQDRIGEKDAVQLRAEQREWLHRRDACTTRVCLEMMYETRAARMERMY